MKITKRHLKRLIREVIRKDARHQNLLMQEGKFEDVMDWIKEKGKSAKEAIQDFFQKFKQELEETREGAGILVKIAKGEALSAEESSALATQISDLAKGIPLLALLTVPGGGVATVALVKLAKKFGINLMPTAFLAEEDDFFGGIFDELGSEEATASGGNPVGGGEGNPMGTWDCDPPEGMSSTNI